MEKKRRPVLFMLICLIALLSFDAVPLTLAETEKNVLLITIDTLRPDRLSCYSKEFCMTPQIDALASNGVLFERAFAHTPTTLPSHANILLGTTPLHHGIHDNSKFRAGEDLLTLAEHLKKNGYSTAAFIGAFPLDSRFGLSQGFDVYDESYSSGKSLEFAPPERKAEEVIEAAQDWLRAQDRPWFCWIHLWDPHAPYSPPEPFGRKFEHDMYSGEVAYVDYELGRLFDFLRDREMWEDTLVVLTADHGESLGEHGEATHSYFAYNSTLWVPLIIAGPGLSARRVVDPVCHIDLFPSICDFLGVEKPSFLQGNSLLPAIKGKTLGKRAIYFESLTPHYNLGAAPLRGFILDGKKYFDLPLPEYYDLTVDFGEKDNLAPRAGMTGQKERLKGMMEKLSSFQKEKVLAEVDRETLDKLRSLGYLSLSSPRIKARYGKEDDPKTLLPYQQKLDEAVGLMDSGKFAECTALLEGIIGEKKNLIQAYTYLHRIYKMQGKLQEASELLREGYENNPDDYNIVSSYGVLLIDQGMYDRGIEVLEQGLALVDFDPMAWNYLGFAYLRKGDEKKALEHYEKSLALDSTFAMTHHSLGVFYFSVFSRTKKWEDYRRSMEYFKRAIEHDPGLFVAYKALGLGYKLGGRIDAAIPVWEKAIELNPGDFTVVLNLGAAYLETGDKKKALDHLERYLAKMGSSLKPEERRKIEQMIEKCKE